MSGWLFALIPVMFTYSGWNAAAYMAEEIKNPGRNVPLALGLGTIAVIAIYLLLNTLYLYVMPVGELAAVKGSVLDVIAEQPARCSGRQHHGRGLDHQPRRGHQRLDVRRAAGVLRDGARRRFLPAAARVHPRYKTPAASIIAQAAWATVLILTGSLDKLTTYVGFAITLFAGIAVAAVFVLRSREPEAPRPFKTLGYPVAPAIFVIASALIVGNALWTDLIRPTIYGGEWGSAAAGLLVIAAGLPVYFVLRSRASSA